MSEYKIESGIEITRRKVNNCYPFSELNMGDSFVESNPNKIVYARACMSDYNKKNPDIQIISRKEGEGIRFWRTK